MCHSKRKKKSIWLLDINRNSCLQFTEDSLLYYIDSIGIRGDLSDKGIETTDRDEIIDAVARDFGFSHWPRYGDKRRDIEFSNLITLIKRNGKDRGLFIR